MPEALFRLTEVCLGEQLEGAAEDYRGAPQLMLGHQCLGFCAGLLSLLGVFVVFGRPRFRGSLILRKKWADLLEETDDTPLMITDAEARQYGQLEAVRSTLEADRA